MADPNLTTFQGRMCTRVKRQVTNTQAPTSISTSTSTSTSTTSTSTSTSTTTTNNGTNGQQPANAAPSQNTSNQQPQGNTTTQQPQGNTNTKPTTTPTTSTTNTPNVGNNRPPQDTTNPQPATTQTTAQVTNQNPQPAVQQSSTTTQQTTIAAAQPAPANTQSQNTEPAQVSNATPNTQNTVPTAPAAGGVQTAPVDPNVVPSQHQSGSTNAASTANPAAVTASPQIVGGGGAQPALAQPDTSPLLAKPVPILLSTGKDGSSIFPVFTDSALFHLPSTSTTILVSTGTNGQLTSSTSTTVVTPTVAHSDGDGHSDGAGHTADGNKMAAGAVVGAVFGIVGFLAIAGALFFCFRRRRRGASWASGTPMINNDRNSAKSALSVKFTGFFARRPSGESFSNTKVALSEKAGALFAGRPSGETFANTKAAMSAKLVAVLAKVKGSPEEKESSVPRMPTPNLERGMRDNSSSIYSKPVRNRSSSVPVMALRDRAMGLFKNARSRSRGMKRDSDTSFVGDKMANAPPRLPSPIAQHRRSAASVSSFIQSWSATDDDNNPFRDPSPDEPLRIKNPDLSRSNTTRNTITKLPPILMPKPYNQSPPLPSSDNVATRSPGIFAAGATAVPTLQPPQKSRHKRSFSQSRIPNPFDDPLPSARPVSPTSVYTTKSIYGAADKILWPESQGQRRHSRNYTVATMGRPLQREPSKSSVDSGFVSAKSPLQGQNEFDDRPGSNSLKPSHQSTLLSSRMGGNSVRSSLSSQDSPFGDSARLSGFDFLNSPADLSSSPGPTRPVTSNYPSYIMDRTSRVSDPFDLDRPEILALMKPTWTQTMASRDTSRTRRDSNGSSKSRQSRAPGTPIQRKNSNAAPYLLASDVYRPL